MKTYYKAIVSTLVMFGVVLSAFTISVSTAMAVTDSDTQFGFDTTFELGNAPDYFNDSSAGDGASSAYSSSSSYTKCTLEASENLVTIGDSVTLDWATSGFDSITINGEAVSGDSGSKTIADLRKSTIFTLEALSNNGSSCMQEVVVNCEPPEPPAECELAVTKSVDKDYAVIGDNITYTITVKNIGDADCTGGGVKIEDVIDPNISYQSYQLTSNLTAGYHAYSIYTDNDRTLRFNGNTLIPGESGTITWVGKVTAPSQCGDFVVTNQAKATAKELNNFNDWSYSQVVETSVGNACYEPKGCELAVTKSVNSDSAVIGDKLTYTIEVKNVGDEDCTGSGVKIEDVVDTNVNYQSYQLTSNFSAGYGTYSTYTNADRTLRFNGNTLTPGESGTITWVGEVVAPTQCGDFTVTNQAKATAYELDNYTAWTYSPIVRTGINNACVVDEYATVVASKIVCTDETQLPNYGNGGPNITANTAIDWVATHNTCSLVSGWEFEMTDNQSSDPGDTLIGKAGAPWTTFGPTDNTGQTFIKINLADLTNDQVWFREVLKGGYIPFTHGLNAGTNSDDISAEFYCNRDVINYDNRDYIRGMQADETYYCVAWNSPIPAVPAPTCDSFTATPNAITVGDSATLTWETSNAVQVFLNNGVGAVALDGSLTVSPLADIIYSLTVIGAEDQTVSCTVPVTVSADQVPVCTAFTATPNALPVGGGNIVLDWEVQDANNVSIAPTIGAVDLIGSTTVDVTAATTFVLTAVDDNGDEVSCSAPVAVADPEPPLTCEDNVSFVISDTVVPTGDDVTLTWNTTGVDAVSISGINATALAGSQTLSLLQDTTFILTATRGTDSVSCSVSAVVENPAAPLSCTNNVSFKATDYSITRGEQTVLNWSTTDVDTVTISTINATALSGSETVSPTNNTTYTLTATRDTESVSCPLSIAVSSGGGGGGTATPRCKLDVSDSKIMSGEEVTLEWDTSNAAGLTLSDDQGEILFTTDNYLNSDKKKYFDWHINLEPTRDTEYTLLVERGHRDEECKVKVEVEDTIVVLQTRDQQPLVAGISLSQVPYTGFDAGPFMTVMFYLLLIAWALYITYLLVIRRKMAVDSGPMNDTQILSDQKQEAMKKAEMIRPDAFVSSVVTTPGPVGVAPANLPTGTPVVGYANETDNVVTENSHQVDNDTVTSLENRAHEKKALLSGDAVRYFIGITTNEVERNELLDKVITEAKKVYPLEDGWIVINESRMKNLCQVCQITADSVKGTTFAPTIVPTGTGSLAEAIVTGNVVAAYQMIGNRPMFALADAAADLDAVYRQRKGETNQVSDLLLKVTANLSDDKIKNMITALTGALDGTYTDEAAAVKMAIMKAVKEAV